MTDRTDVMLHRIFERPRRPGHSLACLVVAAVLAINGAAKAEPAIDAIIDDAGLTEGPVPVRERDGWRAPRKIVVRDEYGLVERLRRAFPDVDIVGVSSSEQAAAAVRGADAVLGFCDARVLDRADRLVWVQIFSAGAEDCLAVDAVGSGDVLLTNMQKMASPVIGEHAVALMLALARGIVPYAKIMSAGDWDREPAGEMLSLNGKTLLVAGLGGIGTAVARRADGLGMRVIATRNSSRSGPAFVDYVGLSGELLELAAQADVVVNALPLTPETTNLFGREFFDAVKPGALFINVARGGSVVTDELVAALEDGRIAGAGLDVTEPEPLPPGHQLWRMDNVIITPHVAGSGNERDHFPILFEENVRRFIAGDALLNVVDPELGY
ncbi:MAG TPA: D-2-hydroxyacid dehydrogenase [Woeseiaceae bacterium]|nr:D-2-hydroxyacid dehydrogenase [Woeseiaceae bacterium]